MGLSKKIVNFWQVLSIEHGRYLFSSFFRVHLIKLHQPFTHHSGFVKLCENFRNNFTGLPIVCHNALIDSITNLWTMLFGNRFTQLHITRAYWIKFILKKLKLSNIIRFIHTFWNTFPSFSKCFIVIKELSFHLPYKSVFPN